MSSYIGDSNFQIGLFFGPTFNNKIHCSLVTVYNKLQNQTDYSIGHLIWTQTLCSGMISLSVSFLPFVGSIMSFLIIFSIHSIVTTFPLQKNDTHLFEIWQITTTASTTGLIVITSVFILMLPAFRANNTYTLFYSYASQV